MVQHSELERQMDYRGTGLVWTGFYVYKKFVDEPNPQNLTPLIRLDPVPIPNARPDNEVDTLTPQVLELDVSGSTNVSLTNEQFSNITLIFTGILTGDVTIIVPSTFNEFYVSNQTTGAFTLSMQISTLLQTLIVLPPTPALPLIVNDCFTLKFVHPEVL